MNSFGLTGDRINAVGLLVCYTTRATANYEPLWAPLEKVARPAIKDALCGKISMGFFSDRSGGFQNYNM